MALSNAQRVAVSGKFFRLGEGRFTVKGITYGPLIPNDRGEPFASVEQTRRDFQMLRELGANVLRLYHAPPLWLMDLALEHDIRLFVDIPWNKHTCFLETRAARKAVRTVVRQNALAFARHPAVFAASVVNEIPPDIARWTGPKKTALFVDELAQIVKDIAPDCLCTFGNYPSSEFLRPESIDFHCFNVYLHFLPEFENYLARLQMIAGDKPLMLGELGMDSLREGEAAQSRFLGWQLNTVFRSGLAGACVFSYTDEWFKEDKIVSDWNFGLTTRDRLPKPAFEVVKACFAAAPGFELPRYPMVSVVVASYNGGATLQKCLASLRRVHYPRYEVILVDDGSLDDTAAIAAQFPEVRYARHPENRGLSAARNTGLAMAAGEIVAYTDSDCEADPEWLRFLIGDMLDGHFQGMGGPNLLPPEDSWMAAAVMASPGGPAHVMLTDRQAEHVPGCNMAFDKASLEAIGGFDPLYRCAGDDVDVCWRLQQRGGRIGFSHPAFVWHHRRSTLKAYLKQQSGYGHAEALLIARHPSQFNMLGGGIWRGRIYGPTPAEFLAPQPRIYHGPFAGGLFQALYQPAPAGMGAWVSSLEYMVFFALPTAAFSAPIPWFRTVAPVVFAAPFVLAFLAAWRSKPAKRHFLSRPAVGALHLLQPWIRGWARFKGRLHPPGRPFKDRETLDSLRLAYEGKSKGAGAFWSEKCRDRMAFISAILDGLRAEQWPFQTGSGWQNHDIEIGGSLWSSVRILSAIETHKDGKWLFRCRLRVRWAFASRLVFLATAFLALFLAVCLFPLTRWSPLSGLLLAAPWCWIRAQCRTHVRLVSKLVADTTAALNRD